MSIMHMNRPVDNSQEIEHLKRQTRVKAIYLWYLVHVLNLF